MGSMKKNRGFMLVKVFKWFIHRRGRRGVTHRRLEPGSAATGINSRVYNWGSFLRHGVKELCSRRSNSGYIRVGEEPPVESRNLVPKGHLVVYVGVEEDDTSRVVVPVTYFNHPLFCDLLREAEKIYGFNHPGGIQIPCRKSEFENVKMKIAATRGGDGCGYRQRRWSWRH